MQVVELILSFLTLAVVAWYTYLTHELLSTQTHQGFENKFFQLLRFHHDIVDAIQTRRLQGVGKIPLSQEPTYVNISGRSVFPMLYNDFVRDYGAEFEKNRHAPLDRLADETYLGFYKRHQDTLGHYFRNLYHLIKFVDNSSLDPSEKAFYTHLVRAQLSSDELLLLFYNCHSPLGKEKFYPLIVKYALLENMSQDNLAGQRLKPPVDENSLYPPGAYGES
jgi:hypothetical protein